LVNPFTIMELIYSPEEDSFLLKETLEKELPELLKEKKDLTFLEIGIGSGIQIEAALEFGVKKVNIAGVDINNWAISFSKEKGFNVFNSNLFENIKDKFDLIIFNPPYLPKDEKEDEESQRITTGGKEGSEIINEFLKQAKEHLESEGKIFLLISSLTKGIDWLNYKKKLIGEKKLFFEKLEVWELKF